MRYILVVLALFLSTSVLTWSQFTGQPEEFETVAITNVFFNPHGGSVMFVFENMDAKSCPFSSLHPQDKNPLRNAPAKKENFHNREFHEKFKKFHQDQRPTPIQRRIEVNQLPVAV